jgi:hypothetical protein
MPDNTKDLKLIERQLQQLVSAIIEKAESDSDFAMQLAKILIFSKTADRRESEKTGQVTFNAVDILHREGREALQRQLELRTDSELKTILRQEGVRRQKSRKPLVRDDAILTIITRAENQLHQGSSFLQTVEPNPRERSESV